jgi:hypothetical protein
VIDSDDVFDAKIVSGLQIRLTVRYVLRFSSRFLDDRFDNDVAVCKVCKRSCAGQTPANLFADRT